MILYKVPVWISPVFLPECHADICLRESLVQATKRPSIPHHFGREHRKPVHSDVPAYCAKADESADESPHRLKYRSSALSLPVSYTHLRAHETRHDLVCR